VIRQATHFPRAVSYKHTVSRPVYTCSWYGCDVVT